MTSAPAVPLVPRGLMAGIAIVLVGAVLLADSQGMLDAHSGWALWPVAVIVAGIAVRLQPGIADRVAGGVLLVAGIWLLFNELGLWTYAFWRIWPLILILLGAWMQYRTWQMRRLAGSGHAGAFAFLSQTSSRANGQLLRDVELSAIAADCTFDLRDAMRSSDPIVVDAFVIGGRIRVGVPGDWIVELRVLPLPGRVTDARAPEPGSVDARIDVVVRGTAIAGVVEVITSAATPPATSGAF